MFKHLPPAAMELGQPFAEYKSRRLNVIGGPITIIVAVILLVVGCQIAQSPIFLGILGMILLPFGLLISLYGLSKRGMRAVLFTDGLLVQDGRKQLIVRWSDITFVHATVTRNFINFIYAGKSYSYTIQINNAPSIRLDNTFERIEELGSSIQAAVSQRQA